MIDVYKIWNQGRRKDDSIGTRLQEYYNTISRWNDRQQVLNDLRDNQASIREGKQDCKLSGMPMGSDMGDPTFEKVDSLLILDEYYDETLAKCWAAYAMHQLINQLLSKEEKELLTLIYYYDYSYTQIAARLKVHRHTARTAHKNALTKLDSFLDTWYIN